MYLLNKQFSGKYLDWYKVRKRQIQLISCFKEGCAFAILLRETNNAKVRLMKAKQKEKFAIVGLGHNVTEIENGGVIYYKLERN